MKAYLCDHAKFLLQFLPYLIVKRDEILRAFDRHCFEPVTLNEYAADYEQM